MKQKRLWMIAAILTICGACIITCCSSNDNPSEQTAGYIPKAPDYSDPAMWITEDGDADGTPATLHDAITMAEWFRRKFVALVYAGSNPVKLPETVGSSKRSGLQIFNLSTRVRSSYRLQTLQ